MSTVTKPVYRSRYGFHAIDYPTFRKLKQLHKRYWQTISALAKWKRWDRKDPQNRVIRKWLRDSEGRKYGFEIVGEQQEPKYCPLFVTSDRWTGFQPNDWDILHAYQEARRPLPSEDMVRETLSARTIEKLYDEVEAWFAENG